MGKWRHFGKRFQAKGLSVAKGQSIPPIYDLGDIFTSALRASVNMSPQVVYIGYGPRYHTLYITYFFVDRDVELYWFVNGGLSV